MPIIMSSSKELSPGQAGKERRESLLQRRERVLGSKSLRYIEPSQPSTQSSRDKRRGQVLQAQRIHRQRTWDYIEELEAEIIRLRNLESSPKLQKTPPEAATSLSQVSSNLELLIRCLNSQVGPGLPVKIDTMLDPELVEQNEWMDSQNSFNQFEWGTDWLETEVPSPLDLRLETFDDLTRMLFQNFSENIAPTLVPFDGPTNGYRTILLPFASENALVRDALLAASANHLRFKQSKLSDIAFNLQASCVEKLSESSRITQCSPDAILNVLATIVLLLISGMMDGPDAFQAVYNIAKSWLKFMGESPQQIQGHLADFLRGEIQMIKTYAQPMLSGKTVIASTYQAPQSPTSSTSIGSLNISESFYALESAIKQACSIYTHHVLNDSPPETIEELLKDLKSTTERLPDHLPGENALAWVYFVGAAESSGQLGRNFFARQLMGIYERGDAPDVATASHLLHLIWNQQLDGGSWTELLKQMPLVFK